MTCREEILKTVRQLAQEEFSPHEVAVAMASGGSKYGLATIKTHITSLMCGHPTGQHIGYDDLVRVAKGRYRLAGAHDHLTRASELRANRKPKNWRPGASNEARRKQLLDLKNETIYRLQVGAGERYVTVQGAAELTRLTIGRVQQLARGDWPAIKIGSAWLIDLDSVLAYRSLARPRNAGPRQLRNTINYINPRKSEVFETRPGVITTAANLCRLFALSWSVMVSLQKRGLPAYRFGAETLIYEDDWEAFLRHEWERPRLKRAFSLPKPDGTIEGPIIPSPMRGLPRSKRNRGQFAGWTEWYVEQLEQGKPPSVPPPLKSRRPARAAEKAVVASEVPKTSRKSRPMPPEPLQPTGVATSRELTFLRGQTIDRLEVGGETYVTTRFAAQALGLGGCQCCTLARTVWPAVKFGSCYLIDHDSVVSYHALPRGDGIEPLDEGKRGFYLQQREILKTRPGIITTLAHLGRSFGMNAYMTGYVKKGLKAQRIGNETIVYEDDWWEFVRREWERPRLQRPWALPKPDGVVPGPKIPSPLMGKSRTEIAESDRSGWERQYVERLEKGEPPPLPAPRSDHTAARYNLPNPKRIRLPRENPFGPPWRVDRLEVESLKFITIKGVASRVGGSIHVAIPIVNEYFPRVHIGRVIVVPERFISHWSEQTGRQPLPNWAAMSTKGEEINTRPGILTTAVSISRQTGISLDVISKWIRKGVPVHKIGNTQLIYEDDFERVTGISIRRPK